VFDIIHFGSSYGVLDKRMEYMSLGKYFVEKMSIPGDSSEMADDERKKKRVLGTSLEFYISQTK
jgi:hypothetical protein